MSAPPTALSAFIIHLSPKNCEAQLEVQTAVQTHTSQDYLHTTSGNSRSRLQLWSHSLRHARCSLLSTAFIGLGPISPPLGFVDCLFAVLIYW
jgi:hypothetical protein